MDTNNMRDISREQFEQRYPVPEGACWNAEQARYVLFHLKLCTVTKFARFVENWVCWQASREAVVVELPAEWVTNVGKMLPPPAVRRGIEAQGLKVAP